MKKISLIILAFGSFAFFSCKDTPKNVEPEVVTIDNSAESKEVYEIAQLDAKFNDSNIETIFKQYLRLEAALINTDAKYAALESAKLQSMIEELDVKADDEIQKSIITMSETDDIEIQRENFETVNGWMEKILEGSLKSGTIYKQYCPMAFNNRGAYWLSTSKDVLNPYFGDKMLKCGRVDSEIISVQ